jgi:hypothetical protein
MENMDVQFDDLQPNCSTDDLRIDDLQIDVPQPTDDETNSMTTQQLDDEFNQCCVYASPINQFWNSYHLNLNRMAGLIQTYIDFMSIQAPDYDESGFPTEIMCGNFNYAICYVITQILDGFNFGRLCYDKHSNRYEVVYPKSIKMSKFMMAEMYVFWDIVEKLNYGIYDFTQLKHNYRRYLPKETDMFMFHIDESYDPYRRHECVVVKASDCGQARNLFETYVEQVKNGTINAPNYSTIIHNMNDDDVKRSKYSDITYGGYCRHNYSMWDFPFDSPYCDTHELKYYVIHIENVHVIVVFQAVNIYDAYILAKQYLVCYRYWDVDVEKVVQEAVIVSNETFTG